MKLGLAQISPFLGNMQKNFELHKDLIIQAKKESVDLLIFPELSLTGYTLKDLIHEVALSSDQNPFFQEFKELSREIALVIGFVEEKDNGLIFNSAAYFAEGKLLHVHRKVFLPTYGMFEEAKFFAQGKNFHTFAAPFGKTGMMICYDFLHYSTSYLLFCGGADMIIAISSAPGRGYAEEPTYATSHMWELMGETISRFSQAYVIYCNRVGFEDGKAFAGGSFIYGPAGNLLNKASYTDETLMIQDIDMEEVRTMRKVWPYQRDNKPEIIMQALKRIIEKYED